MTEAKIKKQKKNITKMVIKVFVSGLSGNKEVRIFFTLGIICTYIYIFV